MELLSSTTTAVKLRSHLYKYLTADADRHTIRQSSSPSPSSIWLIEHTNHAFFDTTIRLRSYSTGLYLAASDSAFLFGMTGKRVDQSETATEWEAVRDGFQIKLRTREGKYLRANGGTPPWRNSVTHDLPVTGATYNWILWDAVAVDLVDEEEAEFAEILTPAGSFSAAEEEEEGEDDERSLWMTPAREWSPARRVVTGKQIILKSKGNNTEGSKIVKDCHVRFLFLFQRGITQKGQRFAVYTVMCDQEDRIPVHFREDSHRTLVLWSDPGICRYKLARLYDLVN